MTITDLRKLIKDIEKTSAKRVASVREEQYSPWSFGVEGIDLSLPDKGLCARSFHDISADHPIDRLSACGFAFAALSRLPHEGDILWCQLFSDASEYGGLYGPGLGWLGIDPGRIIQVQVRSLNDLAWVMEEGVRCAGLGAVMGEGPALDFTATRRLSLACEQAAIPCLYVNLDGSTRASTAATRWRIKADVTSDETSDMPGPGAAAWSVALARCRGGSPGKWQIYWNYETFSFHMVAPVGHREVFAHPAPAGTGTITALRYAG